MTARLISKSRGGTAKLMEKYDCSQVFVSQALNFKSFSMKARLIRHYAVNYLGYIII